jgi:pilus assembly protein Flp/PilA
MSLMLNKVRNLWRNEEGQDLIEYALLVGLISLVAVLAITQAGAAVEQIFNTVVASLQTAL